MNKTVFFIRLISLILCASLVSGGCFASSVDEEDDFYVDIEGKIPLDIDIRLNEDDEYVLVPEVQVNKKLTVLAYKKRPITIWQDPLLPDEGPAVPLIFQNDFQDIICEYDGDARSVATSGCALCCLSMAIWYLTGNDQQDPDSLFREACLSGYYVGNGISQTNLASLASSYGLRAISRAASIGTIRTALRNGGLIIASMDHGYFGVGHYILLRGLRDSDYVYVNDPNDEDKSDECHTLLSVYNQLAGASPLMVLTIKE